jgi:hypothetical protein
LPCRANHDDHSSRPASSKRGVRVVTIRGSGMRWTRLWQLTSAAIADGEVVWSWHPGADAKSRCFDEYRGRRGQERRSPGRSRISRKPFAQGRPDYPAEPVVPAPCIFSHGGRGYQRIPGLPCPLFSFGGSSIGNARVHMCREDGEACLNCEARTQLHIQPSSSASCMARRHPLQVFGDIAGTSN